MFKFLTLFLLLSIIFPLTSSSQEISHDVISPAGKTHKANGVELSWTIGETAVETFNQDDRTTTLGFHQADLVISNVEENISTNKIKVYPNPTTSFLIIDFENEEESDIKISNLSGKIYYENKFVSGDKMTIDINDLPNGNYILEIISKSGDINVYKIVKVK